MHIIKKVWMDEWPAMETDAGRAAMKTPATKAKDLFKVVHQITSEMSEVWHRET